MNWSHLIGLVQLLGWVAAYLYVFWLLYVLIMGFYRAYLNKRLTKPALVLALPAIVVGLLVDFIANWTLKPPVGHGVSEAAVELVTDRLSVEEAIL